MSSKRVKNDQLTAEQLVNRMRRNNNRMNTKGSEAVRRKKKNS